MAAFLLMRWDSESLDKSFDLMEKCFPRTKRITSADNSISEWLNEAAPVENKAVEEGDRLINKNGEIIDEDPVVNKVE